MTEANMTKLGMDCPSGGTFVPISHPTLPPGDIIASKKSQMNPGE